MDVTVRTCQICGRGIKAKKGLIAHHGYQRPGTGWQSASCEGARHLPFEVSCDVLKDHIGRVESRIEDMKTLRAAVEAETVEINLTVPNAHRRYNQRSQPTEISKPMTRETYIQVRDELRAEGHREYAGRSSFDDYKRVTLQSLFHRIEAMTEYLAHQKERLASWKPTEKED